MQPSVVLSFPFIPLTTASTAETPEKEEASFVMVSSEKTLKEAEKAKVGKVMMFCSICDQKFKDKVCWRDHVATQHEDKTAPK